ncbi:MAG: tetratricopeptide repeat protein [Gammaproteobacteria bacterium]|nr:tetratricopeptide repeat protein [Gammaproteobacteria bacterium]
MTDAARADLQKRYAEAVVLHQQGRLREAEDIYRGIIDRAPDHADAIHHLGVIAFQAGHPRDAIDIIRDSVRINPRNAAAYSNLGLAYERCGRYDEAVASYDRALELKPAYPDALYNRGNALRERGDLEAALASYDAALAQHPGYVEAQVNRGRALRELGRPADAIAAYDAALALKPGFAPALLNQAFARLVTGDYARGLPQFEARWQEQQPAGARRSFPAPWWDGSEPVAGATVFLYAEQGIGDTLQFCRYAPLLAARGARVVLEVQQPLVSLMQSLAGVAAVIPAGAPLPAMDFHCPLPSLPLAFATTVETIPAGAAYLGADPQRVADWQERLGPRRHGGAGRRIGLVWSGNAAFLNDRQRSLTLGQLEPLLTADADIVCLQKELREDDVERYRARADRIRFFGDALEDFADTAALTACMDLVVSVDTAGAHLAGALGRPLWLLLPYAPDWCWLLERADSPWYPTARLFRQRAPREWAGVLQEVRAALDAGSA